MSAQQSEKTRLGDILLDKGLINDAQLQEAIRAQQTMHAPLGQILIDKGWLSQRQIDNALKVQSKLRNALVSSLISLSPLALVGCGSAASPLEEGVSVEQVEQSGSQNTGSQAEESNEQQSSDNEPQANQGSGGSANAGQTADETEDESVNAQNDSGDAGSDSANTGNDTVTEEQPAALGAIAFSWNYPTQRTDGSDFEVYEIQGFKIYQVSESGDVDQVHEVEGLDTEFMVTELTSGEYHFAISVIDVDGTESEMSEPISIAI